MNIKNDRRKFDYACFPPSVFENMRQGIENIQGEVKEKSK